MKNTISSMLGIALIAAVSIQSAQSQTLSVASNNGKLSTGSQYSSFTDTLGETAIANPTQGIHPRALKDFAKYYKNANNVYWLKCKDGGAVAGFYALDIKNWATYSKKGWWMYTIKRYDKSKLSKEIEENIYYGYPHYNILSVEEIELPQKLVYLVNIYKGTKLIKLRISENEMEELETFDGFQESTDK